MDYKKLKYSDIENWCFDNGKEDWLEANLDLSFMEMKYQFAKTFMPEILPVAKPKPATMRDRFNARKAATKK